VQVEPLTSHFVLRAILTVSVVDTFDLQAKKASGDGAIQAGHDVRGFDTIADEEEEDVYDEDNEDDDDADALSSSPSIPDDVRLFLILLPVKTNVGFGRTLTSTLCMLSIHSPQQSKARQMPPKATCWSFSTIQIAIGGSCASSKMRL
jgi:hypothetical protein